MLGGMDYNEHRFPELPGWRFSLAEISVGAYLAEGRHADGRSVSRVGSDLPLLIRQTVEDAKYLPEKHHA